MKITFLLNRYSSFFLLNDERRALRILISVHTQSRFKKSEFLKVLQQCFVFWVINFTALC